MYKQILKVLTIAVTIPILSGRKVVKRPPHYSSYLNLYGPKGVEYHEMTTCEEFTATCRFNPYAVLDVKWVMFYSWAPEYGTFTISFFAPTLKEIKWLKNLMDPQVKDPINWSARLLVMMDHTESSTHLLVEQGERCQYLLYGVIRLLDDEKLEPLSVRLKQTGNNQYLAFLKCKKNILYVFAREGAIPKKANIQDAVATIGYRARGGRSYLYQGHQWMPVPEATEEAYWTPRTRYNWYAIEHLYE